MKFREILVGIVGILLVFSAGHLWDYFVSLETADRHEFPFIAPWILILTTVIGIFPGLVIGWFATQRPLLVATIAGLIAGVIEQGTIYGSTLSEYADKFGPTEGPGLDDYLASGVAKAIYLCAFTAFGMVLRERVRANNSFKADGPDGPRP